MRILPAYYSRNVSRTNYYFEQSSFLTYPQNYHCFLAGYYAEYSKKL
jgi:hypothetical protein